MWQGLRLASQVGRRQVPQPAVLAQAVVSAALFEVGLAEQRPWQRLDHSFQVLGQALVRGLAHLPEFSAVSFK